MLLGKTALITGSTSGIGLVIAQHFAQERCRIALNGLGDANTIDRCQRVISDAGSPFVTFCPADMRKPEEISQMIERAHEELGQIDILINNAGVQFTSPIEIFPSEQWDALMTVNLSACFHTIKHTLPIMRAQNFGRIINMISVHGLVASVEKSAYIASKHGLAGLTKAIALETARENITCNGVCPGFVLTPLAQKQIDDKVAQGLSPEEAKRVILSKHPNGQFIDPDDIAAYMLFLCGPHSSSITGTLLPIDGGWTAQ